MTTRANSAFLMPALTSCYPNLCIHNIPDAEGRADACREIARVLKPGGVALISDFIKTGFYQKVLIASGLKVTRTSMNLLSFPPLRIIKAEKPRVVRKLNRLSGLIPATERIQSLKVALPRDRK